MKTQNQIGFEGRFTDLLDMILFFKACDRRLLGVKPLRTVEAIGSWAWVQHGFNDSAELWSCIIEFPI
ncbi:hypothetical protein PanWU01x14_094440 [Parasponia andersonii]|uniref:Uncharacterized protein n=1 Tax=Parasponia andersonii TaxID=3476 RepID=A0A2P5D5S9_PARAD|nr:hypothetical protein PanWU01x14_094440 [Parasponia andersonii]